MVSLMDMAKQHLDTVVFPDEKRTGVVIVTSSPSVNRVDLTAWIMDEFAADPDPNDPFRALYITSQPDVLERTVVALRRVRYKSTGIKADDLVITPKATTLPRLREFNYVKLRSLSKLIGQFATNSLDLVVIDERSANEMDPLARFIDRVKPVLTVVMTNHTPPARNPWTHFGKPLILRGPAQTPPTSATPLA